MHPKLCTSNLDFPLFTEGNRQAREEAGRGEAVTVESGKSWSGDGTRGDGKSLGSASVAFWNGISPSPDWSGFTMQ